MTPPPRSPEPEGSHSRFRGIDGVTQDERDAPPGSNPSSLTYESITRVQRPEQQPLFVADSSDQITSIADLPPLTSEATLPVARTWYRLTLERKRRPANTIKSYSYDLMVLEQLVGQKQIAHITGKDIARYLGDASNKATRKRRLTSARRFFGFLLEERVLNADPTDGYFPHHIELRLPVPLFPDEEERLLSAAATDEMWSEIAIWLMLRLGLTRSELLGLHRDHIDRTDEFNPVVYCYYSDVTKQSKERTLRADRRFAELYEALLASGAAGDNLITVGPPAINSMVDRVRRIAGITKAVTPQVLRHSYAVDQARSGADHVRLLQLLGLTDDPRNRESVDRYIRLALPVNEPAVTD